MEKEEPGFATAVERRELPGGRGGRRAWLIRLKDKRCYWGVSLHRSGGEVVKWHGPFKDMLEAEQDLRAMQKTKGWPLKYNKS